MIKINFNFLLITILFLISPFSVMGQINKSDINATIAKDGTGDYTTIQQAVDAAPSNLTKPWIISIKPGVYKGHVDIPKDKTFLYFIGDNKDNVIITDDRLCGGEGKRYHPIEGATLVAKSSDLFFQDITFENSWGVAKKNGPQALALYTCGDRIILNNCKLLSYQDTYLTTMDPSSRHYIKDCFIEGAVDFIYGRGDVFFDGCTLNIVRKEGGYIVAPCHPDSTKWGYVFLNTIITAPGIANQTSVWLGRPWHESPKTVFINTKAEVTIPQEGWFDHMGGLPTLWADYKTTDNNGNLLDLCKRRKTYYVENKQKERTYKDAKNYLSDKEASEYTISNVLRGSDNWKPEQIVKKYGKMN